MPLASLPANYLSLVMRGNTRSKNGVASLAYDPCIRFFTRVAWTSPAVTIDVHFVAHPSYASTVCMLYRALTGAPLPLPEYRPAGLHGPH